MKTYKNLFQQLCSRENLLLAFTKAQKRKSFKPYVIKFRENLEDNLNLLQEELLSDQYRPRALKTFIVREPKTRKISKSDFRDRIIHHAICNILEPIFDKLFIYDSFANRKGKGSLNAIRRFDKFKLKASRNNTRNCYALKADIKHYFEEVNHDILIDILRKKINDERVISLISRILKNHSEAIGMPLGNMTSQFFANVYLNELDQFVKHQLKAKYYIRYVDDFVILHSNKSALENYKQSISLFLRDRLQLEIHPGKSKILSLDQGISFLGFRNFPYHRLLRKANILNMNRKIKQEDYDSLSEYLEGWTAYAKYADTYNLRNRIAHQIEQVFQGNISLLEIDRLAKYVEI